MDGSAFSHLPVGKIVAMAVVGSVVTILGSIAVVAAAVWWLAHHVHLF